MKLTEQFDSNLAPYAVKHSNSRGRAMAEPVVDDRNEFQRDQSRILHSKHFRVLQYKTQVFANHEGDLNRTRMTHSLEVAQVSRSVARVMRVNEDLAETLALGHDLGHAPFGHLGQTVLNELMKEHGGFEHNLQALRIMDSLERHYIAYPGMNLLFETREGILKHCSAKNAKTLGEVAKRFLPLEEGGSAAYRSPSLEAQLTDLCDAIAYTHADLEDAVAMKVLSVAQAREGIPLFAEGWSRIEAKHGPMKKGDESLYTREVCGLMMKEALSDLIKESTRRVEASGVQSIEDVRAQPKLARFSEAFAKEHHLPMKRFLRESVYESAKVSMFREQQGEMLRVVFNACVQQPKLIDRYSAKDPRGLHRQACDFVASLSDRQAGAFFNEVLPKMTQRTGRKMKA